MPRVEMTRTRKVLLYLLLVYVIGILLLIAFKFTQVVRG
jgi:hypothetical protein